MSLREISELTTIKVQGTLAAAAASSVFRHGVGDGEYVLEYASIRPDQATVNPTIVALTFVPPQDSAIGTVYLGAGVASGDHYPLDVSGPIPILGPGYFQAEARSQTTGDSIMGTISYRKVKYQ